VPSDSLIPPGETDGVTGSLYMAPEVVERIVADDLVFDITPGFPFGGVYHGWADVGQNFFGRLAARVTLAPVTEGFYAEGDQVIVLGQYHAVTPTGADADVRFVHTWTVTEGQMSTLRQTADRQVLHQLMV
jgi:ketosteroid isomerase-like protein